MSSNLSGNVPQLIHVHVCCLHVHVIDREFFKSIYDHSLLTTSVSRKRSCAFCGTSVITGTIGS